MKLNGVSISDSRMILFITIVVYNLNSSSSLEIEGFNFCSSALKHPRFKPQRVELRVEFFKLCRLEACFNNTARKLHRSAHFLGGNIGAKFTLDPVTGMLSMSNLDREAVSKYVLTISAKDKGRPSLEARCNLTVIVLDVNDNAPSFVQNQYTESRPRGSVTGAEYPGFALSNSFSYGSSNYPSNYHPSKYVATISEDVAPDSSVMSVRATDPDQGVNGKITYAIGEETSWLFRVDNLTGVITTAG